MKENTLSGRSLGGYSITSAIDPHTREWRHANNTYLGLSMCRSDLEVLTGVFVNKAVFTDSATPKVTGVE